MSIRLSMITVHWLKLDACSELATSIPIAIESAVH